MVDKANTPVNTDPFISRVSLGNFKSVVDQEVDLARLTLLVGENSSGKSSILQALRLVQQAVKTNATSMIFPLNGNNVRMGVIDEIRTIGSRKSTPVSIGIEVICCDINLRWEASFDGTVTGEPGSTYLKKLRIETQGATEEEKSVLELEHYDSQIEHQICFKYLPLLMRNRTIQFLPFSGIMERNNTRKIAISGAIFSGYFPTHLVTKYPTSLFLAQIWLIGLSMYIRKQRSAGISTEAPLVQTRQELIDFAKSSINGYTENAKSPETAVSRLIDDVKNSTDTVYPIIESSFRPEIEPLYQWSNLISLKRLSDLEDIIYGKEDEKEEYEEEYIEAITLMDTYIRDIASNLDTKDSINGMLDNNEMNLQWYDYHSIESEDDGESHFHTTIDTIYYLGPLRKAPRVIMSSSYYNTNNIGPDGELTASVLRYRGNDMINKVPVPNGNSIESELSLAEAVGKWVSYLGLADDISAEDLAGLGITIKVKPSGVTSKLSLPSVGVGVSQVLPVLVLCLLAEPGSVILLEQPELHLHPALQQKLADFFIAVAKSGRQLIVETHSEYFISRLRRRVVEDPDDELLELVKVVSAERDSETGETQYRDLDLTPYGEIEDWPKGFFDQAAEDEREIIRGALKKRRDRRPPEVAGGGQPV